MCIKNSFTGYCFALSVNSLLASVAANATSNTSEMLLVENLVVYGYRTDLLGTSIAAAEGIIGNAEIARRPVSRTGEILEFVPGMVVTQHSGSGKANQYFLRGFNLDHGTDFATSVDAMPINMRSHGHGQGYTDLNFIIPELIQDIQYRKGPYYAEVGDFSGAGAAQFSLKNSLDKSEVNVTAGDFDYRRLYTATQLDLDSGRLLLGVEAQRYAGPWTDIDEDVNKTNLLVRYTSQIGGGEFSLTAMGYRNRWNAADQIPQRAVEQNIIDPLGSLDTDVGGLTLIGQ
jgi:outer membrane cobalamin receptor